MTSKLTRRALLAGGAAAAAGLGYDAWRQLDTDAYRAAAARLTAPLPESPAPVELIRYASLAANGHNTQPWRFSADDDHIDILPDFSRRTEVVDPDDHHLFASLGCAAETLSIAARASGLAGDIAFDPEARRLRADLTPGAAEPSPLLAAIPERQSTRSAYDGASLDPATLSRLVAAAEARGVAAHVLQSAGDREKILELVVAGNTRQIENPAFVAELKRWIRFNPAAAARTGDGLYTAASGNPTLPGWLGGLAFDIVFTVEAENAKYAAQIRSSAAVIVLEAASDDPAGWIAAGRACQRLQLQATAEGLKSAFVNQAVEEPEMRRALQGLLGIGDKRPNLALRVGRAPTLPRSLRRPVVDVMAG